MKKLILYTTLFFTLIGMVQCDKAGADSTTAYSSTGVGGSTARFTILNSYLYTVDKENLKIYSIANGADPVLKNVVPVGFEIETIYPFKDKLFIGSTSVIYIYSITNPEMPQKLSTAFSPQAFYRCDPVIARDTVAYATHRVNNIICGGVVGQSSVLSVYDIRDINKPVQVSFRNISEPYGLGFSDTTLYVCDKAGLSIFGISNAFQPNFIRTISPTEWFKDVIPYGNTLIAWVKGGVLLFDITNRNNPQFIKKII
jgi:hypothetical protein